VGSCASGFLPSSDLLEWICVSGQWHGPTGTCTPPGQAPALQCLTPPAPATSFNTPTCAVANSGQTCPATCLPGYVQDGSGPLEWICVDGSWFGPTGACTTATSLPAPGIRPTSAGSGEGSDSNGNSNKPNAKKVKEKNKKSKKSKKSKKGRK